MEKSRGPAPKPGDKSPSRKKYRRRRLNALAVVVALVVAVVGVQSLRSLEESSEPSEGLSPEWEYARVGDVPAAAPSGAPDPPDLPLAGVAYNAVASELPGVSPEDVHRVQKSIFDDSWAVARIAAPGRDPEHYYAMFMRKKGKEWEAERSVLVEDQPHPNEVKTLLGGIPVDLVNPMFPKKGEKPGKPAEEPEARAVQVVERATEREGGWEARADNDGGFHKVRVEHEEENLSTDVFLRGEGGEFEVVAVGRGLTSSEAPGFPREMAEKSVMAAWETPTFAGTRAVVEGEPPETVEKGLQQARQAVEAYPGIAGFYAVDIESGAGYGVRPDEPFFSASTIKIPVMAAVYRRIDEGKLDYRDGFETRSEDWAAGAGWLRWETPGAKTTVEDSLWLMMTQSDNVATNALIRLVGGPEYVNRVAEDLGAKDTRLRWKLSSERAAVPSLDNRTTPRDMAMMLHKISTGNAASEFSSREMMGLLEQNNLEFWIESGVPQGTKVANKGGWLDATYNDAGVVQWRERPYVLAIFTKYGPEEIEQGQTALTGVSRAVWLAQSGKTVEQFEKEKKEEQREQKARQARERLKDKAREGG